MIAAQAPKAHRILPLTKIFFQSFFFFFDVDHFKVPVESVTMFLLFHVVFCFSLFACEACGILDPWPGIEPVATALEGEIPATGPPGKSPCFPRF